MLLRGHGRSRDRVARELYPGHDVGLIDLGTVRSGAHAIATAVLDGGRHRVRRFVADSHNEQDLATLAKAAALLESEVHLLTISPGAWLSFHPFELTAVPRFVLVAVGTSTEVSDAQLARLRERSDVAVFTPEGAMELALDRDRFGALLASGPTIAVVAHNACETQRDRIEAAGEVAVQTEALLPVARRLQYRCQAVVASGAYTAQRVADWLKATQLEPLGEPIPLCPLARLVGGPWSGMTVVMKGGLVGHPNALVELVEHVRSDDFVAT